MVVHCSLSCVCTEHSQSISSVITKPFPTTLVVKICYCSVEEIYCFALS